LDAYHDHTKLNTQVMLLQTKSNLCPLQAVEMNKAVALFRTALFGFYEAFALDLVHCWAIGAVVSDTILLEFLDAGPSKDRMFMFDATQMSKRKREKKSIQK
jgi:hypothetical protein